jgi:hypothetical protein
MNRLVALLILTLAAGSVHADAFQCGSSLIGTGDTRDQVMAKCGNRADVERSSVFV